MTRIFAILKVLLTSSFAATLGTNSEIYHAYVRAMCDSIKLFTISFALCRMSVALISRLAFNLRDVDRKITNGNDVFSASTCNWAVYVPKGGPTSMQGRLEVNLEDSTEENGSVRFEAGNGLGEGFTENIVCWKQFTLLLITVTTFIRICLSLSLNFHVQVAWLSLKSIVHCNVCPRYPSWPRPRGSSLLKWRSIKSIRSTPLSERWEWWFGLSTSKILMGKLLQLHIDVQIRQKLLLKNVSGHRGVHGIDEWDYSIRIPPRFFLESKGRRLRLGEV